MENFINEIDRVKKLKILKDIPDAFEPSDDDPNKISEEEICKIEKLIQNAKEGNSYIDILKTKREFNNPENIKKVIDYYKIEEIGSNFPGDIYNPYSIVTSPEGYFDNINRRQTELSYPKPVLSNMTK